jgi:hypothetical protein
MFASPSMLAKSISISPMTAGALSRWEPADGLSSARLRSFRRAAGMLPLAVPRPSGAIEELTSFLNLRNRSDFVLVVAWLLTAGRGPLSITGDIGRAGLR